MSVSSKQNISTEIDKKKDLIVDNYVKKAFNLKLSNVLQSYTNEEL